MLFLPGQLALAGGIFALIPLHELAVLDHVLGDNRHSVLAMIVKGYFANYRIAIFDVSEFRDNFFPIWADLFNRVENHLHSGKGKSAVGLRWIIVFLSVVLLHK